MFMRMIAALVISACFSAVAVAEPVLGPVIEDYGPTFAIDNRDVPVEGDDLYKAVFDVASYRDEKSLHTGLVSVARFMNMHARNGVPVENMDLAVVVHGAALKTMLDDAAYRSRYGVANPNLDLVIKLHSAGVKFYVCGQSMAFNDVDKSELAGPARVALSAMTMLTRLQALGYALL